MSKRWKVEVSNSFYRVKGNEDTKVIDSRISDDWKTIRRRRECETCNNRFTTFEKMEIMDLIVEKSWNRKEKYIRWKLEDSIMITTNKRNISMWKISDLIRTLEFNWNSKEKITCMQTNITTS